MSPLIKTKVVQSNIACATFLFWPSSVCHHTPQAQVGIDKVAIQSNESLFFFLKTHYGERQAACLNKIHNSTNKYIVDFFTNYCTQLFKLTVTTASPLTPKVHYVFFNTISLSCVVSAIKTMLCTL